MAVWNEQLLSSLPGLRLDPEYYQPRYLKLSDELDCLNPVRLGNHDVAFVTDGIHGSPDVVDSGGVRYLSAKCVKDNFFALDDTLQISKTQDAQNPRTRLKVGDVLVTTVGTIGNAAVVTEEILPANSDRHLGIIRLYPASGFDPYFLSTFLNCKYGRFQTFRESTGNVQLNLFIEKIKSLRIPRLSCMEDVAAKTRASYAKRKESEILYREAENLLLGELGLADLDLSPQLFYERRYSEAEAAHRLDAEYFQPKYGRLLDLLGNTGLAFRLGGMLHYCQRGLQPAYEDDGEVLVINSEHVGKRHVELNGNRRTTRAFVEKNHGKGRVRKYDVLLNSTGYITIGRAQTLLNEIEAIVDSHVAVLRPKEGLDPVFLGLFLNSLPGFLQTERGWTGSSGQIELRLDVIKNFTVCQPATETQAKIREWVEASEAAHQESQRLLTEAKRMVEDMVLANSS